MRHKYLVARWVRGVGAMMLMAMLAGSVAIQAKSPKGELQIYFIDVEGGQATLFVAPDHHSLLIDTGWPASNGRDADRIVAAARQAGLQKIDTVLLTHFHDDHVGGVPQLLARIQVGTFIDHGPNRELDGGITEHGYELYQHALATGTSKHLTATPGEALPLPGFDATVISADGNLIDKPVAGAGQVNPYCATSEKRPDDHTENSRSVGTLLRFGKLKILDLGDLTWDKEMQLMCPVNKLGHIDLLVVSHHGWYQSSSPALIDAIAAQVAIMDNGAQKGGSIPTLETFHKAPGLQQLYELHYSEEGGSAHNVDPQYIANVDAPTKTAADAGNYFKVTADRSGAFTVFNSRTGTTKDYAAQ